MSSSGDEENTGPNIDSNDMEERIAARRLRIEKRLEAQRRSQLGEDETQKTDEKIELTKSRSQMEKSYLRLTKLKSDGSDLVSNVRIACDAREAGRRIEEEEIRRQRREKLEAEAKSGAEKFDEITKKWETSLQKEIPQDLHEMLMQQKSMCDAMIDEKNKLINDFQNELKVKDDSYVKDLKKMGEDIDLIIERMDEQVKHLNKGYREELEEIEKSFIAERTDLMDAQKNKWNNMMSSRADKEVEYMKSRDRRVEEHALQLQNLRVQDAEEYNMLKIKLETDVQILEQQLQQMKATYQLNQEKLEYNFQVLRKRDEENTITKSQQKRKITRLQDVLTNLKIKLAKQEKSYRDENQQLSEDYKRITEQFKELQKKSKHFMATDAKKYYDVWIMNENIVKNFVNKMLEEDRIIHEHQLGLPWESPDTSFMQNIGPILSKKASKKVISAHQVAEEALLLAKQDISNETTGEKNSAYSGTKHDQLESTRSGLEKSPSIVQPTRSEIFEKFSPCLVKQILELLSDESGFLIESKLNKLLQPLQKDEQSLMRLDAIFTALGIETEEDVHNMASYFISAKKESASGVRPPHLIKHSVGVGPDPDQFEDVSEQSEKQSVSFASDAASTIQSERLDLTELVHPNDVVKTLRTFVEEWKEPPKDKTRVAQFKISCSDERDDSDDAAYWQSYPNLLSEKRLRLWDGLLDGLDKYSETLNSRSNLITETGALKQQNAELRMLLQQYVSSKVNKELEIPPTRILQLELNQTH